MKTKLTQLKELAAANDWRGALRLAASFARLGEHKTAIVRAHEAFGNARFAVQLGRDPAMDIAAGIAALCARYEIALPAPSAVTIPTAEFYPDRRAAVRAADRSGLDPALLDFRKGDKGWYWVDPAVTVAAPAAAPVAAKAAPKEPKAAARAKRPAAEVPIDPVHEELPVVQVNDEDAATVVDTTPPPAAPAADVVPTSAAGTPDKAPRANARRDAEIAAARAGALPAVPDFSAPTHRGYRRHLAEVVALVEAGDVAGLRAYPIEPKSSTRRILARYRDAAVVALEASHA